MSTLAESVLDRVRSLVRNGEPSNVGVTSAATRTLRVALGVTHEVHFDIAQASGSGCLPAGVDAVATSAALEAEAAARLHTVIRESPERLRRWAETFPDYCARLRGDECVGHVHAVGVQFAHDDCGGTGRITCRACQGRKRVTCTAHYCHGKGQWICTSCDGHGNSRCWGCSGTGYQERQVSETDWSRGQSSATWRTERTTCRQCQGRGTTTCGACTAGWVFCGICHRTGVVNCPACGATGAVACDDCAATGMRHRTAAIRCQVDHDPRFEAGDGDERDAEALRRIGFDALGELAPVARTRVDATASALMLQFALQIEVEHVDVVHGAKRTEMRGYGPARRVLDHHGIVEDLLAPDLAAFEATLQERRGGAGLGAAAAAFLASEIHVLIAAAQGRQTKPGSDDPLTPLIAVGLVSPGYVQRAGTAIGRALPRLYGAFLLPGALTALGVFVAAVVLAYFERVTPWTLVSKVLVLTVLAAIAWTVLELRASHRLRSGLGDALHDRLRARFSPLRRRAWVAAGAVAMAAVIGSAAAGLVASRPHMASADPVVAPLVSDTAVPDTTVTILDLLEDSLGLQMSADDLHGLRGALTAAGVHIVRDELDKSTGYHRIVTEGGQGYRPADVTDARYIFKNSELVMAIIRRPARTSADFEARVAALSAKLPGAPRKPNLASFRCRTGTVLLTADAGEVREQYERYVRRR